MLSSKNLNLTVTELFIRSRKLNISLVFITQCHFQKYQINFYVLFHYQSSERNKAQQIAFNHSLDTDFRDFINFYKNSTAKPYSFLVINTALASVNPLRFKKNLVERIYKVIMTTDNETTNEKLQYDINVEAAKISAFSSGKTDKYQYLAKEEILLSD